LAVGHAITGMGRIGHPASNGWLRRHSNPVQAFPKRLARPAFM
jgi:hypothetical protein